VAAGVKSLAGASPVSRTELVFLWRIKEMKWFYVTRDDQFLGRTWTSNSQRAIQEVKKHHPKPGFFRASTKDPRVKETSRYEQLSLFAKS
jgi:hypothetical protein